MEFPFCYRIKHIVKLFRFNWKREVRFFQWSFFRGTHICYLTIERVFIVFILLSTVELKIRVNVWVRGTNDSNRPRQWRRDRTIALSLCQEGPGFGILHHRALGRNKSCHNLRLTTTKQVRSQLRKLRRQQNALKITKYFRTNYKAKRLLNFSPRQRQDPVDNRNHYWTLCAKKIILPNGKI